MICHRFFCTAMGPHARMAWYCLSTCACSSSYLARSSLLSSTATLTSVFLGSSSSWCPPMVWCCVWRIMQRLSSAAISRASLELIAPLVWKCFLIASSKPFLVSSGCARRKIIWPNRSSMLLLTGVPLAHQRRLPCSAAQALLCCTVGILTV